MKKFKMLSIVLAAILIATFSLFTTKSFASEADESKILLTSEEPEEEVITIGEGTSADVEAESEVEEDPEIYDGDLYVMFGEEDKTATTYTMDKLVDGNVFIIGNDVKITGQINGSLFVLATKLTIEEDAYIGMDLYALAQDITMSGFAFDVYAMGTNFDFTKTGVAYRDLKLMANNAHLIGSVGRDADIGATSITAYDDAENNLFVGNNLNYSSTSEIEHAEDIMVKGKINFEKEEESEDTGTNTFGNFAIEAIQNIVFSVAIYAALLFLAPKFVEKSREYISTRGLLAAAIGLAFTILVPIIAFILLFTVVGVSLALLSVCIYVIVLIFNTAVVTVAINEFICNKIEKLKITWKKILMIIPVSLVLFLIKQIPVLGGLVSIVVFFGGVGIIILYQFDKRRKEKTNVTE